MLIPEPAVSCRVGAIVGAFDANYCSKANFEIFYLVSTKTRNQRIEENGGVNERIADRELMRRRVFLLIRPPARELVRRAVSGGVMWPQQGTGRWIGFGSVGEKTLPGKSTLNFQNALATTDSVNGHRFTTRPYNEGQR